MPTAVTPSTLLLRQLEEFSKLLPALREGSSEAIHQARVATRRIRAIVPLLAGRFTPADLENIDNVLRKLTRRLGRARDVDVQLELLGSIEPAIPRTGEDIQMLRSEWRARRDKRVRRLIKSLERLRVEQQLGGVAARLRTHAPAFLVARRYPFAAPAWENVLGAELRDLAGAVAADIDRAGGVMFSTRLHEARISIKKLRYAMEIATVTGRANLERSVRSVRKAQQILGSLHDLDVLAEAVRKTPHGEQRILPVVEYQRRALHGRYLRRRAAVLAACSDAATAASRGHRARIARRTALIASVPIAMLAIPFARRAG
jgi:CHAD domain-containing protein